MTYLSWLEFIFDTMLDALSLHFHRGEDQAVPHEMCGVSHSLASFKTANRERGAFRWKQSLRGTPSVKIHQRSPFYSAWFQPPPVLLLSFEITMYFIKWEQRLSVVWKSNCFRVKECDQIAARRDAPMMGGLFFAPTQTELRLIKFELPSRKSFVGSFLRALDFRASSPALPRHGPLCLACSRRSVM